MNLGNTVLDKKSLKDIDYMCICKEMIHMEFIIVSLGEEITRGVEKPHI